MGTDVTELAGIVAVLYAKLSCQACLDSHLSKQTDVGPQFVRIVLGV